jgi:hypothetical protein
VTGAAAATAAAAAVATAEFPGPARPHILRAAEIRYNRDAPMSSLSYHHVGPRGLGGYRATTAFAIVD